MGRGEARRLHVADVAHLAALDREASLRSGDRARTAARWPARRGAGLSPRTSPQRRRRIHDIIARTGNDIVYWKGQPAFALLDYDTKGMPPAIKAEIERHGGFWPALTSVLPDLAAVARVTR